MAYYGYGDTGNQFYQGRTYGWLPQAVQDQVNKANQSGQIGNNDNNGYQALGTSSNSTNLKNIMTQTGKSRDDALKMIGMDPSWNVTDDMPLVFSNAKAANGDVSGGLWNTLPDFTNLGSVAPGLRGENAVIDDKYKGYTQLGNLGPLEDDIRNLLGDTFKKYGVENNQAAQDAIKNKLFTFDPRFGVLANEDFVKAATDKNNSRSHGMFSDIAKFELFNGGNILKQLASNPTRLLTGVDPLSTKAWNAVLGTNNKPLVDQFGGATKDTYQQAAANNIPTKAGAQAQGIAHLIASIYAGGGISSAAGGGALGSAAGAGAVNAGNQLSNGGKFDLGSLAQSMALAGLTQGIGKNVGSYTGNANLGTLAGSASGQLIKNGKLDLGGLLSSFAGSQIGSSFGKNPAILFKLAMAAKNAAGKKG